MNVRLKLQTNIMSWQIKNPYNRLIEMIKRMVLNLFNGLVRHIHSEQIQGNRKRFRDLY